jgi:hypothetical protein
MIHIYNMKILRRCSTWIWLKLSNKTLWATPNLLVDLLSIDIMVRIVMLMTALAFAQVHGEAPELGFRV